MAVAKNKRSRKKSARNKTNPDTSLRKHLVELLNASKAHVAMTDAFANFPMEKRGTYASGLEHTPWQLLEHIRIANWDILEFSKNAKHASPPWPEGYWPKTEAPPNAAAWDKSVRQVRASMKGMIRLVRSKKIDLFAPIPHGTGQTVLREALLIADHNAYHVGQMVLLRRLLGAWKG